MIRVFFGKPGVGKTTLCCKMAYKNRHRYDHTYCNFSNSVPGCATCDTKELGSKWTFPLHSYIALDEAGIEFNSRKTLSLPQPMIAWFKLHRHYRCDIDVFSQSWNDMDITLRRLTNELWYMYRLGPWTLCRKVYKRVTVDKHTEQIIDGYRMANMLWIFGGVFWLLGLTDKKFMLTFRPFYYRYFDSWERQDLPIKEFPIQNPIAEQVAPVPPDGTGAADQQDNPADLPAESAADQPSDRILK